MLRLRQQSGPGQHIKIENTTFELAYIEQQEALALKIVRGVRPTYKLLRDARNIIGGVTHDPEKIYS